MKIVYIDHVTGEQSEVGTVGPMCHDTVTKALDNEVDKDIAFYIHKVISWHETPDGIVSFVVWYSVDGQVGYLTGIAFKESNDES
jgi:hypothetical protein